MTISYRALNVDPSARERSKAEKLETNAGLAATFAIPFGSMAQGGGFSENLRIGGKLMGGVGIAGAYAGLSPAATMKQQRIASRYVSNARDFDAQAGAFGAKPAMKVAHIGTQPVGHISLEKLSATIAELIAQAEMLNPGAPGPRSVGPEYSASATRAAQSPEAIADRVIAAMFGQNAPHQSDVPDMNAEAGQRVSGPFGDPPDDVGRPVGGKVPPNASTGAGGVPPTNASVWQRLRASAEQGADRLGDALNPGERRIKFKNGVPIEEVVTRSANPLRGALGTAAKIALLPLGAIALNEGYQAATTAARERRADAQFAAAMDVINTQPGFLDGPANRMRQDLGPNFEPVARRGFDMVSRYAPTIARDPRLAAEFMSRLGSDAATGAMTGTELLARIQNMATLEGQLQKTAPSLASPLSNLLAGMI